MRTCECSCHEGEARPEAVMRIESLPTELQPEPPEPDELCVFCLARFGRDIADDVVEALVARHHRAKLN